MTTPVEAGPRHQHGRNLLWLTRALGYLVYAYVIVVEVILILGFLLLLLGANPTSSFVDWIYGSLDRAMEPFRGIFTPIELGTPGSSEVESVLDTSVLFAMIIYALVALAVRALIDWLSFRIEKLDREDREQRQRLAYEQAAAAYRGGTPPPSPPPAGTPPTTPTAPTRAYPPQEPMA